MSNQVSEVQSPYNPLNIAVGDTIKIRPHMTSSLSGIASESYLSNQVGVVMGLFKKYDWESGVSQARIRYLDKSGYEACFTSHALSNLDLLTKGDGQYVLGVTHPFSGRELYDQRLAAFDAKIKATIVKWEGWSNAATHQAYLILNTSSQAVQRIFGIRRKDGSVHTGKLEVIFRELDEKVEDWAFEPILDVPAEFEREISRHNWRPQINWGEIANEFQIKHQELVIAD